MRSLDAPFRNLLYAYNISSSLKDYQNFMKQLYGTKKASLLMMFAVFEVQPVYVDSKDHQTTSNETFIACIRALLTILPSQSRFLTLQGRPLDESPRGSHVGPDTFCGHQKSTEAQK